MEVRDKGKRLTEEEAMEIARRGKRDIVVWDGNAVVAVYTNDGRLIVVRREGA